MPRNVQGLLSLQPGGRASSGNHSSSRGCPSGSRNLNAVTPPDAGGNVCGPAREIGTQPWQPESFCIALPISDTTMAKCWNAVLFPGAKMRNADLVATSSIDCSPSIKSGGDDDVQPNAIW